MRDHPDSQTPPWVAPFYDRKSNAAGPSGVLDHHRERATAICRLTGQGTGRVLELGAGAGGSAVATAELGYDVTAVELSPVRAGFAETLRKEHDDIALTVIQGDFLEVRHEAVFDIVTMWNGFGVGDDCYQRRILERAVGQWLSVNGTMVIDVFNPSSWARWAGECEVDDETGLRQEIDYDVDSSRFIDRWWFDGPDAEPLQQSVRCYSPADLRLLVEGTGLDVMLIEHQVAGTDGAPALASGAHGETWGYRAVLNRSAPQA